jgi:hypothetical protein
LMLAQNAEDDYVKQACLCAMSIHSTNKDARVSLVTNDIVPEEYKKYFDQIIPIPWNDDAEFSEWKIENRWKLYHATPYEKTVVLDTDMLVLQDLSSWWEFLDMYDLYFTTNVYTYRGERITSKYYRKGFVANNLYNLYTGVHYFKKSDQAAEFYKWMELITQNWELFYGQFHKEHYPSRPSMDVTAAITAKILNCEHDITNELAKYPTFTHMKSRAQNWQKPRDKWQEVVDVHLTATNLMIGNYKQTGIFHYTEKSFVDDDKLKVYKEYLECK